MRKFSVVLLIVFAASLSNACVASKKFVRSEVKTSADTLNVRVDQTNGEVGEVRDGVMRASCPNHGREVAEC